MPSTERLEPGIWKIAAVVLLEAAGRDGNSAVGACGGDGYSFEVAQAALFLLSDRACFITDKC